MSDRESQLDQISTLYRQRFVVLAAELAQEVYDLVGNRPAVSDAYGYIEDMVSDLTYEARLQIDEEADVIAERESREDVAWLNARLV